jgi:hypothetical protein
MQLVAIARNIGPVVVLEQCEATTVRRLFEQLNAGADSVDYVERCPSSSGRRTHQ